MSRSPASLARLAVHALAVVFLVAGCAPEPDSSATNQPQRPAKLQRKHRADDPQEGVRWLPDVETALAKAAEDGRPIFISCSSRRGGVCDSSRY